MCYYIALALQAFSIGKSVGPANIDIVIGKWIGHSGLGHPNGKVNETGGAGRATVLPLYQLTKLIIVREAKLC